MTINEAIGYADALARNTGEGIDIEGFDVQVFGMLCRDALRLMKMTSENATPDAKAEKTTKVDMNANEYQRKAMRTATHKCYDLANAALGLTGEAGEVADIIKKHLYQGHDLYPSEVIEELGDVLWYVALMADYFNVTLSFVMQQNITKLKARYPEGFDPVRSVNKEVLRKEACGLSERTGRHCRIGEQGMNEKYCVMCKGKLWAHPIYRIKVGEAEDGGAAEMCPKCAKKYANHLLERVDMAEQAAKSMEEMDKRLHVSKTPLNVSEDE